jgi:hypothetical protein
VCIRAAGNDKVLARSLCNRDTLFEIRFGQFGKFLVTEYTVVLKRILIDTDLLFESFSQDFVYNEVRWYHGTPRQINLALIFDQYSPNKQMLALTVQDYSQSEFEDPIIYHRLATDEGHFDVVQSQRCAIIPNGLPRVEELLAWAQIDTATTEVSPVQRLITALHGFMQTYCQNTPELPLVSLARLLSFGETPF